MYKLKYLQAKLWAKKTQNYKPKQGHSEKMSDGQEASFSPFTVCPSEHFLHCWDRKLKKHNLLFFTVPTIPKKLSALL